jgi:RNA polymerase sigma-70 factor (ECF subfamily)
LTYRDGDDRALLGRMLDGDEAAFDAFVDEYYPRLFRFALPRLDGDREVAQDVVQGTFEKVIPKLSRYRGEAALFTWLCSFCRFEIAAYWRKAGRREREVELAEDAPAVRAALDSLAMGQDAPGVELERKELARLVRVVLDHLPLHYSQALEWKYLRGLPVNEIARRMGSSPKAAESLLTRARQAFRDGFAELGGGWAS